MHYSEHLSVLSCKVQNSGGGIGGITLAFFILKYATDIHVDLYEAGPQFSEIGAGITVWKRTWKIMQLLGLDGQLGEIAMKVPKEELSECCVQSILSSC